MAARPLKFVALGVSLFVLGVPQFACAEGGAGPAPLPEPPSVVPLPEPPQLPDPPARYTPGVWPADGSPQAGRYGDYFYLRDVGDQFRLYIGGRAHVDAYAPFGPGVSNAAAGLGLQPTVFLRRARPELSGEFLGHWQWTIAGEWGRSTVDNGNGQAAQSNCSVNATSGALTCTQRAAPVEAASYQAQATDVFINYRFARELNLEAGQMKIPFSLENRTSENITPFLENSLAVRSLGAPTVRDIGVMVWGDSDYVHYELGLFDGDGPNRTNQDGNFDGIGRVFARPFRLTRGPLAAIQIGVSGHYGVRNTRTVGYDYTTLTTQEGYAFWKPVYTDSYGNLVHILPSRGQATVAAELYWPVSVFDLTAEVIGADHGTREARDGYQLTSTFTERYGTMRGYSYYVQAALWLFGDRQYVRRPGYLDPIHVDFAAPSPVEPTSLELLAKVEQLNLTYASAGHSGAPNPKSPDGTISTTVFTAAINYWATRRVRFSLNYGIYVFPDSAPTSPSAPGGPQQTSVQRALAPGQQLAKGGDDWARDHGHTLNELSLRAAVGF